MFSCLQGRYFVPLESCENQWAQISLCPSLSPTNMICVSMSICVFSTSFAVGYSTSTYAQAIWYDVLNFSVSRNCENWHSVYRYVCTTCVSICLSMYLSNPVQSNPIQSNLLYHVISVYIRTIIRIMEGRTDGLQDVGQRDRRRGGCVGDCHSCHLWIKAVSIS